MEAAQAHPSLLCQNATLCEISCLGSNCIQLLLLASEYEWLSQSNQFMQYKINCMTNSGDPEAGSSGSMLYAK